MLRAQELGMTTDEYVYILPEYVQNENKTDLWSSSNRNQDGRNQEAKGAFDTVLFVGFISFMLLVKVHDFFF